jgi:uncharacterized membrane protein
MMPPTGLTFIVHVLIVVVQKILGLFGIGKKSGNVKPDKLPNKRLQTSLSIVVIVIVSAYLSWLVIFFVGRSIHDSRANWKVINRTAVIAKEAYDDHGFTKQQKESVTVKYYDDDVGKYYQSMLTAMYQMKIN